MRVFLDTNVIISAFATRGLCEDVMRAVLTEHDLIMGEVVLDEVERVLGEKLRVPSETARSILSMLSQQTIVPRPQQLPDVKLEDLDDLPVLASALGGRAEVIVTGDRELLELGTIEGIPILSPRAFWEMLSRS